MFKNTPLAHPLAHFDLQNAAAYKKWRKQKLSAYPATLDDIKVTIKDSKQITASEISKLQFNFDRYNMAIYACDDTSENKQIPLRIARCFGLQTLDANIGADIENVTSIQVKKTGVHGRYIPYTDAKLSWHSDGYYNRLNQQIRGMLLHCVRPAKSGGENQLLDHEIAYITLRDQNPDFIRALCKRNVMTIPANEKDGKTLRAEQSGPVFSFDANGDLHMRYSARTRNIIWQDDEITQQAVSALSALFSPINTAILSGTLQAGEGLICNNVLHNRSPFKEDKAAPRLLYRLRFYERITTQAASGA